MIFQSLLEDPLFELYCESLNWGHTSWITHETPLVQKAKECANKLQMIKHQNNGQLPQFDLFVHVTIPQEFERLGKFNVGVTAGVETDRVSHPWIQKVNEMDLVVVPSEHAKKSFMNTVVDWHNPNTGEKGQLRAEKPIVVCPEGIDTSLFKKTEYKNLIGLKLETDFNFLSIAQWGNGGFGEDRKNIALMLKYFLETFRGRKDVGLVLKTNMARNSAMDYEMVMMRLKELKQVVGIPETECPPIYLVHANLTKEEMVDLYNHPKIKAFITLTHGEGFGIPVLEAASVGLPILATNWSGHLDILKDGKYIPLEYDLTDIPDVAVWDPILIKGSRWASVKEEDVKKKMEKIVSHYSKPASWAKELSEKVKEKFDIKKTNALFVEELKKALLEQKMSEINPEEHLKSFVDTPDDYNVIYCMPMSTGDVFVSTGVIAGLKKELPEGSKIYFATQPQYFPILEDNPDIYKLIPWNQSMITVDLLDNVFDLSLTPNADTQFTFSNYVRKGQGRNLVEQYANHCLLDKENIGEYWIKEDVSTYEKELKDINYMTIHAGSGQGQWAARKYIDFDEILHNIKQLVPNLKIVQVGSGDEMNLKSVDIDLKGKTSVHQLAGIMKNSILHLGIDSFPMHLASKYNTPLVALFGSSYAKSSGPFYKDLNRAKFILIETEDRLGCQKACYKYNCFKNQDMPCINGIDPVQVFKSCARLLLEKKQ